MGSGPLLGPVDLGLGERKGRGGEQVARERWERGNLEEENTGKMEEQ